MMEVAHEIVVKTDDKPEAQPQYTVLLGDSQAHTFKFVEDICIEICAMNAQQAQLTAKAVHEAGKAPVFVGGWDDCILTRDKVRSKGGDADARGMGVASEAAIPCWIEEV